MKKNTGLCLIHHFILNCSGVLRLLLSILLSTFTFLPLSHQKLMAYWRPQVQGQRSSFQKFLWMSQLKKEVTWDFHISAKVTSTETLRWGWPEVNASENLLWFHLYPTGPCVQRLRGSRRVRMHTAALKHWANSHTQQQTAGQSYLNRGDPQTTQV